MKVFVVMDIVSIGQISEHWMIHVRNGRKTKNERSGIYGRWSELFRGRMPKTVFL